MIKRKNWQEMSLSKLVMADWNYKQDDPVKAQKLQANIKRNGQLENIMVRKLATGFFEVVNGNHRLTAFQELGIKKVVVYNFGTISDAQARRIAVETNETRFKSDHLKLAGLVKEMVNSDFTMEELAETMPYNMDELKDMQELLVFDWSQYDKKPSEDDKGSGKDDTGEQSYVCPACGHIFVPGK